jgi:hypothetical protein
MKGNGKMINDFIGVIKKVHSLAEKRRLEYESRERKDSGIAGVIKMSDVEEVEDTSGLLEYLKTQNMETIRVIHTISIIGSQYMTETEDEYYKRMDYEYENPEDDFPQPQLRNENPEELFQNWLSDNSGVTEWKDLHAEICDIYKKIQLDKHLERAFKILGIK